METTETVVEKQLEVTPQSINSPDETPNDSTQISESNKINWKNFRETRDAERKYAEEANKRAAAKEEEAAALKAAMDALLMDRRPPSIAYDQPGEEESEDQRIENKVKEALKKQQLKYEEEQRRREVVELPSKLKQTYSDFDAVCSTENLDYLEFHYPEVASAFKSSPDSYDKWISVYKAVKRFIPNADNSRDKKQAEKNLNKPQSMSVGGATQTGDNPPVMLDDKRRADNWSRMQKIMKGGR